MASAVGMFLAGVVAMLALCIGLGRWVRGAVDERTLSETAAELAVEHRKREDAAIKAAKERADAQANPRPLDDVVRDWVRSTADSDPAPEA